MNYIPEDKTAIAFRMFCEAMQSVEDQGKNADRQLAVEAIDAIIMAWFSETETRALIGAISRSVLSGEINDDDRKEFDKTLRYLEEVGQ